MRAPLSAAERFNSASHLAGALLALAALVALVWRALGSGDRTRLASLAVYGGSLLALYTASTLYHAFQGPVKAWLRKLDHLAIYLLIAGTYTPFALLKLRDSLGLTLLVVIWSLAALGALIEFLPVTRALSVGLYLAMGWLALGVVRPMAAALDGAGLAWVLAGGLCYTLGTLFYAFDKRWPAAHGVFHVFVLAGSLSHFVAVWGWVA